LAKEESVLQDLSDILIEIGGCTGMDMNVEKTNAMGIAREPSPAQIIEQKKLENVDFIDYLGNMISNNVRYENKSRISME
jgi:hypothetical protein